jgi:VWFA-related protein
MLRPAIVCVALAAVPLAGAQQPDVPSQPLKTGISAVVIDVVVRDGKGRPVTDLRKEDFQLLEDGVEQQIGDMTVAGVVDTRAARPARGNKSLAAAGSGANDANASATAAVPAGADFLAIVFDRLSPDARALAYRGALAAVDTLRDGDFVGIFVSNLSLETIQPYTNDRDRIRKGIREAATRATAAFDRLSMRQKEYDTLGNVLPGDAHPSVPDVASAESEGRPVDGRTSLLRLMGSLQVGTHAAWELMSRDYQGYATTNALMAVTSALGMLPGRKTVVFFAEGLAIPDAVLPHFRDVVMTANRANVSVYSVDAAGLRVHSEDATTAREVTAMAALGTHLKADGSNSSSLAVLERNEDVLRKDPRTSLSLLADQTGGFLIENTNDLASGFRRIDGDRRFHYLLTYAPRSSESDGKWRSVVVRVPSREVTVRARAGYLAVRSASTLPVLAYEGPALAALERSPAPEDLPLRAAAFVFPGRSEPRVVVLAATDAAAVRFDRDGTGSGYRTDFTIVARVLDERHQVVRKASEPYRLSGPAQQEEQARRGEVLFYRQPALASGTYTLETAVHDALGGASGVRRTQFVVPAATPGDLQVSSLVLARRAERVPPEERQKDNPLFVGEALIYPNLGEPVVKSQQKALTFLVALQAGKGDAPAATMQVVQAGKAIVEGPIALPPPNADGRIDHVLQIASESLPAGRYTFRLTIVQGDRREVREAQFELVD